MPVHFPNESAAYRKARNELLALEISLRDQVAKVAALRQQLPEGGVVNDDYIFQAQDKKGIPFTKNLSELFNDDKQSLFIYSFMFGSDAHQPCPMCSAFLDALNAQARFLVQRINVAVVARSPIKRICEFAAARGWNDLQMLSSSHNNYHADYLSENESGEQLPMINVFVRRGATIRHFWGSELLFAPADGHPRHVDMLWPLWNVLDTTPTGRGDYFPPLDI